MTQGIRASYLLLPLDPEDLEPELDDPEVLPDEEDRLTVPEER